MFKRKVCSQVKFLYKYYQFQNIFILMLAIYVYDIVLQHFGMIVIGTGLKVIISLCGAVVVTISKKLEILSKPDRIENIVHFIKTISKLANMFKS